MPLRLWRVFPWNPAASAGAPYSPGFLPAQSGQGRFDLPITADASSWYFAETPEHAIGEKVQDLRGRTLRDGFLFERGHRLALVSVEVAGLTVADLCDPHEIAGRGVPPDRLAYRDRGETQAIAARLHADVNTAGFRWWSAFWGEWHTVILFSDRLPDGALRFGEPEGLFLDSTPLRRAASLLGIETTE